MRQLQAIIFDMDGVIVDSESRHERAFLEVVREIGYSDKLAHLVEAGSDFFVMPSRYEPCGLNQMYSMKYGTIPVVRATGGLDDAVIDFDADQDRGNGFKFVPPTQKALLEALLRAIARYQDKPLWTKLMRQAMFCDHSWERSAGEYVKLYEEILKL